MWGLAQLKMLIPAWLMEPASAGALAVEEVAGEAAGRAVELRAVTDKGARLRKKKALNDLLKALAGFGFTRRRSAIPALDRTVPQWFTQVSTLACAACACMCCTALGFRRGVGEGRCESECECELCHNGSAR